MYTHFKSYNLLVTKYNSWVIMFFILIIDLPMIVMKMILFLSKWVDLGQNNYLLHFI